MIGALGVNGWLAWKSKQPYVNIPVKERMTSGKKDWHLNLGTVLDVSGFGILIIIKKITYNIQISYLSVATSYCSSLQCLYQFFFNRFYNLFMLYPSTVIQGISLLVVIKYHSSHFSKAGLSLIWADCRQDLPYFHFTKSLASNPLTQVSNIYTKWRWSCLSYAPLDLQTLPLRLIFT